MDEVEEPPIPECLIPFSDCLREFRATNEIGETWDNDMRDRLWPIIVAKAKEFGIDIDPESGALTMRLN